MKRDWFWQILELGQGPDFVFFATFVPADAESLARLVRQHLPAGFVHDTEFLEPQWRGNCGSYDLYLDQHTYNRLLTMRDSGEQQSIYYYAEIKVCDNQLTISNILAGINYQETDLLIALAQSPELSLQAWKVVYAGYSVGEVACGVDATSLLNYLQLENSP